MDEGQRVPHLRDLLQAGHTGPQQLQAVQVGVLYPRRGPAHQELQVAALAAPAQLHLGRPPPPHGDAPAEQPHGALVAHALPDALRVRVAPRLQGVVLQPDGRHGGGHLGLQRRPGEAAPQDPPPVPLEAAEERGGEAAAQKV